ncbi:hypothetical protein MMC24_000150 [Lignoscripta atroalba]|nr:hypothetical protein [Lignoscripta atroalba]
MAPYYQPVVLNPVELTSFITYVLQQHAFPTILIICSSREAFLNTLQAACCYNSPEVSPSQQQNTAVVKHHLLIPTIHLLASSRDISLAFTPTLPHLRAFLATYVPVEDSRTQYTTYEKPGSQVPILALLNPLALHRSTSEYSAQGLSRTFALATEAAARGKMQLTVSECPPFHEDEVMDLGDDHNEVTRIDPWTEQVPLLNGSVRFGGEERVWAGRTVEVGRVVRRWCKILEMDSAENG